MVVGVEGGVCGGCCGDDDKHGETQCLWRDDLDDDGGGDGDVDDEDDVDYDVDAMVGILTDIGVGRS